MKLKIIKEVISEKYFAIINCDNCNLYLAKLFKSSAECHINHKFYNLCNKCWKKLKGIENE